MSCLQTWIADRPICSPNVRENNAIVHRNCLRVHQENALLDTICEHLHWNYVHFLPDYEFVHLMKVVVLQICDFLLPIYDFVHRS